MSNNNKSTFLLSFIIFLTSFSLGIIFSLQVDNLINKDLLKSNNISYKNENLDLSKYWITYNLIKDEYFDENTIDNEKLVESSISGLIEGLGDKHSTYFNSEENKSFEETLAGDFEGIGAVVETHVLGVKIDRIIKGSPAKKYDLRSGDILIKANGIELEGLNLAEAVSHIKGKAGTEVILDILRVGESDVLTKEVVREKIKIPSINTEEIDENIGYISINMFGEETSEEFRKSIDTFKDKDGIIIDLRDNGGGFLGSAVEILNELIENDKTLVVTKYKESKYNDIYKSNNSGYSYKGKIVVLINENSASASEITAGTLREYNKAILVGKQSYGKGSVQKPFELTDGSMIKLTVAKWFTPNGINIDAEGIIPDIEISFENDDYENHYDRQKEEAIKILDIFIEKDALGLTVDTYLKETEIENE